MSFHSRWMDALVLLGEIVDYIDEHPEWAKEYFFEHDDAWENDWHRRAKAYLENQPKR